MIIDKNKKHSEYLALLKTVKSVSFPEIDFSKALYLDSLYVLDFHWIKALTTVIRSLFFKVPELDIRIGNNQVLMLTTIHARNDHDSYWGAIKELFPVKDEIIFHNRFTAKKYLQSISLWGITDRIRRYRKAYGTLKIIGNRFHRSCLASKMVTCEKYIGAIKDQIKDTKVVFAFCDTFLFENVMIQYMRHRGIVSITTQHGQPVFFGWDKDHLNQSQILNFSSDYYLAKGNFARRQFVKAGFDETRIIVLGSMNHTIRKLSDRSSQNVFGVFTDCILYDFAGYTNPKLVAMAEAVSEKMNMSYFIKVHPSETAPDYHRLVSHRCIGIYRQEYSNEVLFGRIAFGIMSASAIYLDMLYANVKCYQMQTKIIFPIVESPSDLFETCEQLADKFRAWRKLSSKEKEQYFAEQQKEYGSCENTGQKIQNFVSSILNPIKSQEK